MILFNKQITKALIRLRGCEGWSDSAPLLFVNPRRQVFSCRCPIMEAGEGHQRNSSSSSKIVYLSVTSQIYTNKTYSKTKDIRDPA